VTPRTSCCLLSPGHKYQYRFKETEKISTFSNWIRTPLGIAVLVAISARLVVYFGSMVWPIPNESLMPVSPLHTQVYLDFRFYLQSLEQYRSLSFLELLDKFISFYQRPFNEQFGHIIAGPVFPGLVGIFDYNPKNTLPLATFYLGTSCVLSFVWLKYLDANGVGFIWLIGLALAPNPIWFTLIVSPDILFAALVAFFHYFYFKKGRKFTDGVFWLGFLLLILLTRPNGYSILLFVFIDFGYRLVRGDKDSLPGAAFFAILMALFALYLYPYFITEARKTVSDAIFFGLKASNYRSGLFSDLPRFLDVTISWIMLAAVKLLYFVGLRPTYGDTSWWLVLFRAGAGAILLPGLIFVAFKAPRREQLFLAIFFLPIFFGPTQDRYNLPLFAILFRYGSIVWDYLFARLLKSNSLAKISSR
jgi:hypothetical protein